MLTLFTTAALIATAPAADTLLVSAEWLAARLNDPKVVVLTAGMSEDEFRRGHIPGARFIDLMAVHGHDGKVPVEPIIRAMERAGVTPESRIVIYGSGVDMSPGIVFTALDLAGLGARASILDGGLPAWERSGRPLSKELPAPKRTTLSLRPNPDVLVDAPYVKAAMGSAVLLDTRSRGEFTGTNGEGLSRPGRIPGGVHLEWSRTLDPQTGKFLPRAELEALFREAGAKPGSEVITYCLIGMRASHMYFVSRLLGYKTRVYVGSMVDWSSRPKDEYPMVTGTAGTR